MVPTFTMHRLTGSAPSFSPAASPRATPQAFLVASWPAMTTDVGVVVPVHGADAHCCPAHIHQVGAGHHT